MFLIKIFNFLLNVIYTVLKIFPIKNKVTFISRQSNSVSSDFIMIGDMLKKENKDIKIVYLCKKLENGIGNKIKYFFHMFRQMYHLSTSRVVVLDSYCIVASILKKRKGTTIIQTWHAMGAFKKFGYSILDKDEGSKRDLAIAMKMHNNYDYVFVSSEYCKKFYKEAFNCSEDNLVVMPLPRVDFLTDSNNIKNVKNKIYKKYPLLKAKKNIVYVPTFRKDESDSDKIYDLINSIDYKKYNLIIKLHPLSKVVINDDRVLMDKLFSSNDMLMVSDYIITDYSAIVYEACLLKKPIYFYCYDYKKYYKKRNFYLDYKTEMPGPIEEDASLLIKKIEENKFDFNKIKDFTEKYITFKKGTCTKNIVKFIMNKLNRD